MRPRSRPRPEEISPPSRDDIIDEPTAIRQSQRRASDADNRADQGTDPPSRIETSDHVDIVVDVKGKGRAVDHSVVDNINCITDGASDVDAAKVKDTRPGDRVRQESTEVTFDNSTTPSRSSSPVSLPCDVNKASRLKLPTESRDPPKVRWNALQAVDAHLAHASIERSVARGNGSRRHDPHIEHTASQSMTRGTEISIRGAAKATNVAPLAPTVSSPELSHEARGHNSSSVPHNPTIGMSSREIMTRTRARLAQLRQEPILSPSISSERGEHDASSLDTPQAIVELEPLSVAGNQIVPSSSSFPLSPTIFDVPDNSAAQSSSSHSVSQSVGPQAGALRAKLLGKLDVEKRAYLEQTDPSVERAAAASPMEADGSKDMGGLPVSADNEIQHRGPDGGGLVFRRDAQMLESNLRTKAYLRVKLAAAKRTLADTTADESNADVSLVSREEYLRSQLKRGLSQ